MSVTTHTLPTETTQTIGLVGRHVTYAAQQWRVHSVEGYDYYAFQTATPTEIEIDLGMIAHEWKREPRAYLIPTDATMGQGLGIEVMVKDVKRGVCLTKRGDSIWH